uniref:Uncharacterized protein n=1 Tax=Rhizophora mucronata TaxID=61149 RepID=A0A2P2J299_RHIMU
MQDMAAIWRFTSKKVKQNWLLQRHVT